jgi:hypothetical protein
MSTVSRTLRDRGAGSKASRLSMRARTRAGQKTPADLDAIVANFAAKVKATMKNLGIKKVYNADHRYIFWSQFLFVHKF